MAGDEIDKAKASWKRILVDRRKGYRAWVLKQQARQERKDGRQKDEPKALAG